MRRFAIALITLCAATPAAVADNDHDIKMDALPKAAQDTVKREVKKGQITQIEREEHQGRVYFEVEYTDANKRHELHVAEDGKVLMRKPD